MRKLYENRRKRGDEPPPPSITIYTKGYWEAWEEISTERNYAGMGGVPLPLPASKIREYGVWHSYTGEGIKELVAILRIVDSAYLGHWHEKHQKNQPPSNTGNEVK